MTPLLLMGWASLSVLSSSTYYSLTATFEPAAKGKTDASVAITFSPTQPDLKLNEQPAPRLNLDPAQVVLEDRQPPRSTAAVDPDTVKAIDVSQPVRFPVALRAKAPRGDSVVTGSVVYFYCSKREGWCRRGNTEVEFPVTVP
jgi:hypothetical protein